MVGVALDAIDSMLDNICASLESYHTYGTLLQECIIRFYVYFVLGKSSLSGSRGPSSNIPSLIEFSLIYDSMTCLDPFSLSRHPSRRLETLLLDLSLSSSDGRVSIGVNKAAALLAILELSTLGRADADTGGVDLGAALLSIVVNIWKR